jgi:transcriptional regulator with XRE-family HTH domain
MNLNSCSFPGSRRLNRHLRSVRELALRRELTELRKAANLTQRQAAERMKRAASYIAKVEGGELSMRTLDFADYVAKLGGRPHEVLRRIWEAGE